MKKNFVIESLVAAVFITVLFIVMVPNFQKAQHTAGVTKSLHDLSEISKAIEIVNQNVSGEKRLNEIHQVWVRDMGEDAEPKTLFTPLAGFRNATSRIFDPFPIVGWEPQQNKELDALLTFDHRPPPSMLLLNNYVFKNEYVIETGLWRKFLRELGRNPNSLTLADTLPFDKEAKLPFVGIAKGPFFDAHIGEQNVATAETSFTFGQGRIDFYQIDLVSDTQTVEYNPTNGVRSHGYVVYRSPAGPVASITDVFPNYHRLPVPQN